MRVLVPAALVAALAAFSIQRNHTWSDEVGLWEDVAGHSPGKARPNFNLAVAYLNAGLWAEAEKGFRRTLEVYPDYHKAKYYIGESLFRQGKFDESLRFMKEVERLYEDILPSFPEKSAGVAAAFLRADLYNNMGSIYYNLGDRVRAEKYYMEALEADPSHLRAREGLVSSLLESGRRAEALRQMEELLVRAPADYHRRQEVEDMIMTMRGGG